MLFEKRARASTRPLEIRIAWWKESPKFRSFFFFFFFLSSNGRGSFAYISSGAAPRCWLGAVRCSPPRSACGRITDSSKKNPSLFLYVVFFLLFYSDSARSPGPPLQLTSSLCISGFIRCTYYIVYIRQGRMLLSLLLLVADARKDPRIIVTISGTNFFPLIRAS